MLSGVLAIPRHFFQESCFFIRKFIGEVEADGLGGLAFLGVGELGVDGGGAHVGVAEHPGDGVDVGASFDLQSGIGVAEAVEGDVAFDARSLDPFLQRS